MSEEQSPKVVMEVKMYPNPKNKSDLLCSRIVEAAINLPESETQKALLGHIEFSGMVIIPKAWGITDGIFSNSSLKFVDACPPSEYEYERKISPRRVEDSDTDDTRDDMNETLCDKTTTTERSKGKPTIDY